MPRYDFCCQVCGHVFEAEQSATEVFAPACPNCAGMTQKAILTAPVQLKPHLQAAQTAEKPTDSHTHGPHCSCALHNQALIRELMHGEEANPEAD